MRVLSIGLILLLTACSTQPSIYRNYELTDWSRRGEVASDTPLPRITFSASRFSATASGDSPCGRWRAEIEPAASAFSPAAFADARRVSGECPDAASAEVEQAFLAALTHPEAIVRLSGNSLSIRAKEDWFSFYDQSPRRFFGLKF